MKCQRIELESGETVVVNWSSKQKCKDCNKEIFIALIKGKLIKIELVGNAEWDRHKCKLKNKGGGKSE